MSNEQRDDAPRHRDTEDRTDHRPDYRTDTREAPRQKARLEAPRFRWQKKMPNPQCRAPELDTLLRGLGENQFCGEK